MSYTLTRKDGVIYELDDEQGADLKNHWVESTRPFPVEVGDDAFSSVEIKFITRNPRTASSMFPIKDADRMLQTGNECRGFKSINAELLTEAKRQGNFKLLKDKEWRERTKAELRKEGEWCDQEAGTCVCPARA